MSSSRALRDVTEKYGKHYSASAVGEVNVDAKMKEKYQHENVSDIDGIKIDFADSWVYLRKSNTESIICIYSEAKTMEQAVGLAHKIIAEIKGLV